MKNLFAVLGLVAVSGSAFAQSFTESFNVVTGGTGASGTLTADQSWAYANNAVTVGSTTWFQGNTTVFTGHSGGYIGANFNSTTGSNAISTWLWSPVRTLNNGDTFSFYSRSINSSFPDRLHLKLGLNGASTNVADYSTVLTSINPNLTVGGYPGVWTQYTVTLSGLSGPTSGRFAFHYDVTNAGPSGANSDYIGIDTVAYTANPVPEPATMAVLGLGAAALIRRRRNK